MNKNAQPASIWFWLTLPIAISLTIATASGVFIDGLYRDAPNFVAQARGQDLVSLMIALPALILSAIFANRGSRRALLIWLGTLIYLVYTYVIASFDVRFNPLFLVYVALFGCSLYALIGGLVTANLTFIKQGFAEKTPTQAMSILLAVIAILFYFIWLGEALPASLAGRIPQSVIDNGTPTNAVHVLDMGWILPSLGMAAVQLWRERPLGFALAGALLVFLVLLVVAILSMVVFMARAGQPVEIPMVAIFGVLLTASLGMLIWYFNNLK